MQMGNIWKASSHPSCMEVPGEVEARLLCSSSAWELILGSLSSSDSLLVCAGSMLGAEAVPHSYPSIPES